MVVEEQHKYKSSSARRRERLRRTAVRTSKRTTELLLQACPFIGRKASDDSTCDWNVDVDPFVPGTSGAWATVDWESLTFTLSAGDLRAEAGSGARRCMDDTSVVGASCGRKILKEPCSADVLPQVPWADVASCQVRADTPGAETCARRMLRDTCVAEVLPEVFAEQCVQEIEEEGDDVVAGRLSVWPAPGEQWQFNGRADYVQTYADSGGLAMNKGNCMGCRGGNRNYQRVVEIEEVELPGQMVKIRGTHNMTWVKGWISAVDDGGQLIFDYVGGESRKKHFCNKCTPGSDKLTTLD